MLIISILTSKMPSRYARWKHSTSKRCPSVHLAYTDFDSITPSVIAVLSKAKWDSLRYLLLDCNNLGNLGCKNLSKMTMHILEELYLSHLLIIQLETLSKMQAQCISLRDRWPTFAKFGWVELFIYSGHNPIGLNGTNKLVRAHWTNLNKLVLRDNWLIQTIARWLFQTFFIRYLLKLKSISMVCVSFYILRK